LSVFAQGGEKGPFLTNKLFDNVFVSVGGGANLYFGETDMDVAFGKRSAPALDISLGKWITPAVGVRLQYAGLKGKGGSPWATQFVYDTSDGFFAKKFNYTFVHADALWNASTTFGGYRADRFWEFVPFAGFGAAIAGNTTGDKLRNKEFALAAGLLNKIRISPALDANLEFRGMLVNQVFDNVVGGRWPEGMGSITVGLSYKFAKRGFEKAAGTKDALAALENEKAQLRNRLSALENEYASASSRADQLANDLAVARTEIKYETEYLFPDVAIFFEIGKATLSRKEQVNVDYIAEALKKMPAGKKIVLDGNADSVTGTHKRNMTLGEMRIKTVYDELIKRGVKAEQIEFINHGDLQEPFGRENPALNRVLIIEQ
jgi:outer membrane protein OmpA-like peptidoglycan-associated protein